MSTALAERQSTTSMLPADVERVLMQGDLSKLTPEQKLAYYNATCESIGLNPLTQPFEYINLNGKLRLYAKKDCTDQLRALRDVSVEVADRLVMDDLYIVRARASTPSGRVDESLGAVSISGLRGEARANAMMKAETKAKRRVTLSICGLGFLDESETPDITARVRVERPPIAPMIQQGGDTIETATGEVVDEQRPGVISKDQVRRLWTTARKNGWSDEDVKRWLQDTYKLESSRDIPIALYDGIVAELEKPNPEAAPSDEQEPF